MTQQQQVYSVTVCICENGHYGTKTRHDVLNEA